MKTSFFYLCQKIDKREAVNKIKMISKGCLFQSLSRFFAGFSQYLPTVTTCLMSGLQFGPANCVFA